MFEGRNFDIDTATLATSRARYQLYAFLENNGKGKNMIKDFSFYENMLYGLVNRNFDSIILQENLLEQLNNGNDGKKIHMVHPMVKSGIIEMRRNMQLNLAFKKIVPTNLEMVTLDLYRSYESPIEKYFNYIDALMIKYHDYLDITNIHLILAL